MNIFRARLTKNNYIYLGLIRVIMACALLLFAALAVNELYFSETAKLPRVEATVTGNSEHTLGRGTESQEVIFTPVLSYTVDGEVYEATSGVQALSKPYKIGQKVEIQYYPSNPQRIYQPSNSRTNALYAVITISLIPGVILLVRTLRELKVAVLRYQHQ